MYSKTSFQENEENRYFTLQLSKIYIYIYIYTLIRNMIRNVGRGWRLSEFKVEEGTTRRHVYNLASLITLHILTIVEDEGESMVGVHIVNYRPGRHSPIETN